MPSIDLELLRLSLLWSRHTPFWGYLASTVPARLSEAYSTAACLSRNDEGNGICIAFNPGYMSKLGLAQQQFVYIHELQHMVHQHFRRRKGRNKSKWNSAADMAINEQTCRDYPPHLHGAPEMPRGLLLLPPHLNLPVPEQYAEKIYDLLPDEESEDIHAGWDTLEGIPPDLVRVTLVDGLTYALKSAGTVPGGVEEILQELLSPKINWKRVLRKVIGSGMKVGFESTWSRLNRRLGEETKGHKPIRSGEITTIIDSSGSITNEWLTQFLSEIAHQARLHTVTVIVCDAKVHTVMRYRRRMQIPIKGRGGTDMNPALKEADRRKAKTVVILTDGYLCAAPIKTRAKQIWVLTPDGTDTYLKGRTVIKMTDL